MQQDKSLVVLENIRETLAKTYHKQLNNYFGDPKKALKFLTSVVWSVEHTPGLIECTPQSIINSFMMMAQLGFMPSPVSGEAYVLPYKNKKKIIGEDGQERFVVVSEAQFQIGYQGIVTLLYRARNKEVRSEIVREHDEFTITNGQILHKIDPFKTAKERGKEMGAYAIIITSQDGRVEKFMRADEILSMGERFSKSWSSQFSPWKSGNDPELWMWKKTVLKQAAKLAPKNEEVSIAIAEDNKDSDIEERMELARLESEGMKMGSLAGAAKTEEVKNEKTPTKKAKAKEDPGKVADSLPSIQVGD